MMFVTSNINPWLVCPIPRPQAQIRLICFPYAGASAQIFHSWSQLLPDWIEQRGEFYDVQQIWVSAG